MFVCAAPAHAADGLLTAHVTAVSPDRPVLVIDRGGQDGLVSGDRVVCVAEGLPVAAGTVIRVEPTAAAVRCAVFNRDALRAGEDALVLSGEIAAAVRTQLGGAVYGVAHVDSVLPGAERVWIDAGSREGWNAGEAVLLRRGETIFAWGAVVERDARVALVRLDTRRRPALAPRRGDYVEQIGALVAGCAPRTRVAGIGPAEDASMLILAGGPECGFAPEMRCDLFRGGAYVGFARLTDVDPVVRAEALAAYQRVAPAPGDTAIMRSASPMDEVRVGYVFRLEADYALLTLGEADGIKTGQTLYAPRADGTLARLSVRALYPDHCGAELVDPPADGAVPLALGDAVRTRADPPGAGEGLRAVRSAEALADVAWLYAVQFSGTTAADVGDFVALPEAGVGVVVGGGAQRVFAVRIDGVGH